ncbi:MAG: PilN domain-containing protein [Gammaproteobacteria bacterium]|nr:PilN domain-containing protein [Gammaproteobacteria bacterium]MDE0441262.1 PilN domain-containing protein [Gammaproteobacteria bacterium]
MIARINLLPWRQRRRDRQRRAFLGQLGGVFAGSFCLVFLAALVLDGRIASQDARNGFLRSRLLELQRQADAIDEVRRRTDETLERLQVLVDLRRDRTRTVRILEELARTVTPGVHYTSLVKRGKHITAHGVARSNHAISALMRNLDASEQFEAPRLKGIEEMSANAEADLAAAFELTIATSVPRTQGGAR